MTIDEAIKHCEEVAEEQDMKAGFETDYQTYTMSETERERCRECANEHRQLAEWLRELKQLREQTRWIPVSERLPEDYGEYICTMNDDNVQECGFVPIGEKGLIPGWSTCEADGFKKLDYRDVIAWMPLPQHYKEESVDEE